MAVNPCLRIAGLPAPPDKQMYHSDPAIPDSVGGTSMTSSGEVSAGSYDIDVYPDRNSPLVSDNSEIVEVFGTTVSYNPILPSHGWLTVGANKTKLPYLIRDNGGRFIPLSVIEKVFLFGHPDPFPEEELGRPPMRGFYLTTEEVRLLNRFVTQSYTHQLGLARFSLKDMLIAIYDFVDFYKRLQTVSTRLTIVSLPPRQEGMSSVQGGWSQVNNTVVPYVMRNKVKMVPLSVIRYAAGLLCNVEVPSLDANHEECQHLNESCVGEGLNFEFALNTKLIELFLIPTLSNNRVTIVELPKTEPMQHAKVLNGYNDRRSVFVAASVRNNEMTKGKIRRKTPRKCAPTAVKGVATSNIQPLPAQNNPTEPTNILTSFQECQMSPSSSTEWTTNGQPVVPVPEIKISPQHGVRKVVVPPATAQQNAVVLPQSSKYPTPMRQVASNSNTVQPQPAFIILNIDQTAVVPELSTTAIGATPTVQASTPIISEAIHEMPEPIYMIAGTMPAISESNSSAPAIPEPVTAITTLTPTAPAIPMPESAMPSSKSELSPTALHMPTPIPAMSARKPAMPAIIPAMPALLPTVSTPLNVMLSPTNSMKEPGSFLPGLKPFTSEMTDTIPELIISLPEAPSDMIKIDLTNDINETDPNCDTKLCTLLSLDKSFHRNKYNEDFSNRMTRREQVPPDDVNRTQLDFLKEKDDCFLIKRQKLTDAGNVSVLRDNEPRNQPLWTSNLVRL
ncbi:hypothetical protein LSH36_300g00011 [Paralvinella palmiformis]|uniref:Uncharacterized protein n=1 Tax=Paralvinella palmiformis TaxID=53620 RepID=A0AAD9N2R4_9ANNE|nr:hypothetical protein LSH36_300g00011 [Paralvinella palmiformis]